MFKTAVLFLSIIGLTACTSKEGVKKLLVENPDILVEAIEANPDKVMMALNSAAKKAQEAMAKQQEEEESKSLEASFENPLNPVVTDDKILRGPKDAPITLVIYSDFECPYCARGFKNENELEEKFKGKIRVVFKNLPLPMHPHAKIAAQYFEAVRLQSNEKAAKFHDAIFSNQDKLQQGESFLKSIAKDLKVDMTKLAVDVKSDKVKDIIEADMKEANDFGFQGTPGYIFNGIPVRGAYPTSHFLDIAEKLKAKGKLTY